jgi:hypothetical protein
MAGTFVGERDLGGPAYTGCGSAVQHACGCGAMTMRNGKAAIAE